MPTMRVFSIGSVSYGYLCVRERVVEKRSKSACVWNKENADSIVGCKILQ